MDTPVPAVGLTAHPRPWAGEAARQDQHGDDESLPPHAEVLADGRVRLPLCHPVALAPQLDDAIREPRPLRVLAMRRLNGQDRLMAEASPPEERVLILMARSAGICLDHFTMLYRQLDSADIACLHQVIGHLLGLDPRTRGAPCRR